MRHFTPFLLIVVVVLFAASTLTVAGEDSWFDMENCGFCQSLLEPPDMLAHATWEHHNISNGLVSVSTVDKKYIEQWRAAEAKMEAAGKKMEQGEQVKMCNACTAMGKLFMMGAKWESIQTTHGGVSLITSDDPATVKEIQGWGKKTTDELAKMEKMEHKK